MCCQPLSLIAATAAGKNIQQSEFRHAGLVRGSGEEKQKVCGSVHILTFSTFFFFFLNQKFKSKPKEVYWDRFTSATAWR